MGQVTAISPLIPGAEVSVSDSIVRIEMGNSVRYFDALSVKELSTEVAERRNFALLVSVPGDAPRPVVLVNCDMPFDGDFSPRALDFLRQGAHYTTTLEGRLPIPEEEEEAELICDMAYILNETETGAVLLGVLSADTA